MHLIPVHRRIVIFSKEDGQVDFQFRLDVVAPAPVAVSGLVDLRQVVRAEDIVQGLFVILAMGNP